MKPEEALRQARERWPRLEVDAAALSRVWPRGIPAAARAHAAELVLACACASGDAEAHAALDQLLRRNLPPAFRARDGEERLRASADELLQQVRTKLLVGVNGGKPKILDYSGKGPLEAWLRAALARTAANLAAARKWEGPLDEDLLAALPAEHLEPELRVARDRHATAFKAAFRAAVAALAERDRAVLRMYVLEGMKVHQIGAVYRVDRSTAVRWMVRIRQQLLEHTQRELARAVGAKPSETESLVRALGSQLDASLSALRIRPGRQA